MLLTILQAGATACLGLVREAMLKSSETILVNGGGGNLVSSHSGSQSAEARK